MAHESGPHRCNRSGERRITLQEADSWDARYHTRDNVTTMGVRSGTALRHASSGNLQPNDRRGGGPERIGKQFSRPEQRCDAELDLGNL